MAEAGRLVSGRIFNPIPIPYPANSKSLKLLSQSSKIRAASKRNDFSLIKKKASRTPRRLITISTSNRKWHGNWTCDYLLSLQDLCLQDLVEDENKHAQLFVNLSIQKHASFGFSVDGRILTSFTRKCSICSTPYCREIDTNFNVWVLPSSSENHAIDQLPEIGSDDPSVIYVKPGCEADLDSLVQDTIRLTTSGKDTCSELCEKSEPTLQHIGRQNTASTDKRWAKLLELKKAH